MCRSTPIPEVRGFSLLETLVFLVVITVAILGLLSAQVYALRCGNYNRHRHTASTLAESILSEATAQLNRKFDQDLSYPPQPVAYQPDFQSALLCTYQPDSGGDQNLKRLVAAVYWRDPNQSQQRSLQVWTYVYRTH